MKCAVHTEVDATGYCRNCGKALCPECVRDVRGALYCEDCLSGLVFGKPTTPPGSGRPGVAFALGLIPGLGAVYNSEYLKALIHVAVFGSMVAAQSSDVPSSLHVLLAFAMACFYFYMPIDAYRVAKAREVGTAASALAGFPDFDRNKPVGAMILIGLGVFLLLANFGLFRWDWFGRLWPLGLIALGAWLLFGRTRQES